MIARWRWLPRLLQAGRAALYRRLASLVGPRLPAARGSGGIVVHDVLFFLGTLVVFKDFLDWIRSAAQTLDVCIYIVSCPIVSMPLLSTSCDHDVFSINRFVLCMCYIGLELLRAAERGVTMRVVTDRTMETADYPIIPARQELTPNANLQDIDCRRVAVRTMYHKYALIDSDTLITGSFNWSGAAHETNKEHILVLGGLCLLHHFKVRFELTSHKKQRGFKAFLFRASQPPSTPAAASETKTRRRIRLHSRPPAERNRNAPLLNRNLHSVPRARLPSRSLTDRPASSQPSTTVSHQPDPPDRSLPSNRTTNKATARMTGSHSRRKLGITSVALITYFNVSGGPWGSEPVIAACGPFVGILAVTIFPWIWCLPLALTFAELFTAFPTDGSFCKWVGVAFGRPMGFQVGFWSWVAGVIDNAIYPCLIVDTIMALYAGDLTGAGDDDAVTLTVVQRFLFRAVFAVLFMIPTLTSIKIVGHTLLVMGLMIFLPFAVMIVISIPQVNPSNWFVIREDRDWGRLLSALYWNYSGFDAAGAYAGEIHSPKTTYPRAMILCVIMIAFTYIIPFIAISGADKPHYTSWDDGSYSVIAQAVGGTWLCVWIVVSSLFGNLGLYVAEMAKDGFQLAGMADSGLAPPFFAQRDEENGVPRRAILLSFSIVVFMGLFNFETILSIDNFLSALASLVEMSAAVKMRFSHPEIERPYRVNLSDRNLAIAMILPFIVGVFIMINELTKSWVSFGLNVGVLIFGYGCQRWIQRHPYHQYEMIETPRLKDLTLEY